jgi:hypothetical protein
VPPPLPKNPRLDEQARGIYFEVEIDGRSREAFITFEAVDHLYAGTGPGPHRNAEIIRAVSHSSYVTRLVAERIRTGDEEPIHLTNATLVAKELEASNRRKATQQPDE